VRCVSGTIAERQGLARPAGAGRLQHAAGLGGAGVLDYTSTSMLPLEEWFCATNADKPVTCQLPTEAIVLG
jgi:hypothetical protein